jgi:hypothetical protein
MKRNRFSLLAGGALVLMGLLVLLQEMGLIPEVNWFWAAIFIFAGIAFLIVFARKRSRWWALIPGMTLAGVGVTMLLPAPLSYLGGAITLGAVGLSFLFIYLSAHENWWALIPGGVLLTLAAISLATPYLPDMDLGALLFFGLSLTFLFVAVLPNPYGRMTWAFIPSGILLLFALLALSARFQQYAVYVWPVILIGAGVYLLVLYFRRSRAR